MKMLLNYCTLLLPSYFITSFFIAIFLNYYTVFLNYYKANVLLFITPLQILRVIFLHRYYCKRVTEVREVKAIDVFLVACCPIEEIPGWRRLSLTLSPNPTFFLF